MSEKILPQAERETTDVAVRPMLIAFVLILASLGGLALFARWLYPVAMADAERRLQVPHFAEPVLQPNTAIDMNAFYAAEMNRLNSTGWVDPAHTTVHIPIADAMREVAQKGIPDWPTTRTRPVP